VEKNGITVQSINENGEDSRMGILPARHS
jgi:hypothetical protein